MLEPTIFVERFLFSVHALEASDRASIQYKDVVLPV